MLAQGYRLVESAVDKSAVAGCIAAELEQAAVRPELAYRNPHKTLRFPLVGYRTSCKMP